MQLISSIEIVIRVVFFFSALLSYIGLGWAGDTRSSLGNTFYILLVFILLFFVFKSIKSTNKNLYVTTAIIGICISIYFIYESIVIIGNPPLIYIMNSIGFITLIIILLFFSRSTSPKL